MFTVDKNNIFSFLVCFVQNFCSGECMKVFRFIIFFMFLASFISYAQDFQKIYIDFMRVYDSGDYVRAFKILDEVVSKYEMVPDYFYIKSLDSLNMGYNSGKFSYGYFTNTLYRYYNLLVSRNVYNEPVWEGFVSVVEDYELHKLYYNSIKNLFFVNVSNEVGLFSLVKKLFSEKKYSEIVNLYKNNPIDIKSPKIAYLILLSKIYEQDYSDFDSILKLVAYNYDSDDIRYIVSSVYYGIMDFDSAWHILMLSKNPDPDLKLKLMVLRRENPKKIRSFISENKDKLDERLVEFVDIVLKGGREYVSELENRLFFDYDIEPLQLGLAFTFPKNSKIYRMGVEKAIVNFFSRKMYKKVIELAEGYSGKSKYIRLLLGISYFNLGENKKAFNILRDLESSFFQAKVRLPYVCLKLDMRKEAIEKAKSLVKDIKDKDDIFKYFLARIFLEVKDFENFDRVMSYVKSTNNYFYGLLHSYKFFGEKKYSESESILIELLEEYPYNSEVMNSLAYVWAEQNKNLMEALKLSKFSLVFDEDYSYLDTLAYVYYRLNDLENARKTIERSISLMEKKRDFSRTIYLRAAMIYKSLGEKEKSKIMINKASRGGGL